MSKRAIKAVTNPSDMAQLRFREDSNSDAVSEAGLNYFWSTSVVTNAGMLGALNVAVPVVTYRSVLVVNIDAAIQYVALSKSGAMVAPAGGATGIPIAPNGGSIILAIADNTYIRSSSANVFGYLSNDSIIELPDNI